MAINYIDRVYGEVKITDSVILDLINCDTLQRLKEIDQAGYFEPFYPNTKHSRFEHSVGDYLLLKKYGASIEEQISGLIHDVSHSAFSHCIDYVLDGGSQEKHCYQDDIFKNFVLKTEIPEILKKHNFDLDYILDESNFPLQEKDLPNLCADRIDYSLRTAIVFGEIDGAEYFLNKLLAKNNKWIFRNFESAQKYAELFLKLNKSYFSGIESAAMFQTVGDCLKYALSEKYILEKDLYSTDREVLDKVKSKINTDPKLKLLFDRMNNKVGFKNDPNNYDAKVFCKSRIVDPLCMHNSKIKRVSEINLGWKDIMIEELKPKEYFLKFEK